MSLDIFECLINDIEPDVPQKWPAVIGDTLHKLKEDEKPLDSSPEYHTFSTGMIAKVLQCRERLICA